MPVRNSNWKDVQERGSRLGIRTVVACYRLFGRPLAVGLTHMVITYFFLTDRPGRKASLDYLDRVHRKMLSSGKASTAPGLGEVFLHYRAFALAILDRLIFWLGDGGSFDFEVEGEGTLEAIRATGRGAIFVGAHLGNFDALTMIATQDAVRVNVVMYSQHTPRINSILSELSPDKEVRVIECDPHSIGTVFTIRSCIERGEMVAIHADRNDPIERTCRVPFLGSDADFLQTPFLLAQRLGCPLVLILGLRAGARRYRVVTELLAPESAPNRSVEQDEICGQVAHYALRLEHFCTEAPHQWFNFFDFWKEDRTEMPSRSQQP